MRMDRTVPSAWFCVRFLGASNEVRVWQECQGDAFCSKNAGGIPGTAS